MINIIDSIDSFKPFLSSGIKHNKQLRLFDKQNNEAIYNKIADFSIYNCLSVVELYSYNNLLILNQTDRSEYFVYYEISEIIEYLNKTISIKEIKPSNNRWWSYLPNWMFCTPDFIHIDYIPIFRNYLINIIKDIDIWKSCSDIEMETLNIWTSKLKISL